MEIKKKKNAVNKTSSKLLVTRRNPLQDDNGTVQKYNSEFSTHNGTDTRWRYFICSDSERAVTALDTELCRIPVRKRSLVVHLVAPVAHLSIPPSIHSLIWPTAAFTSHPCTLFLLLQALSGLQSHPKRHLQIYFPLPLPAA